MPLNLYLLPPADLPLAGELSGTLRRPLLMADSEAQLRRLAREEEYAVVAITSPTLSDRCRGELANSGFLLAPGICSLPYALELTAAWRSALPRKTAAFRSLLKQCAKSSGEFGLFAPDDRILVGVSGGEDSLMLMHLLTALQKRLPFRIEIFPALVDMGYPGFNAPALADYCQAQGWTLQIERLEEIQEFFAENAVQSKPCALCSRLRRGRLHRLLDTLHCNKLALGHHLDDLCTSFMIALFRGGGLKTMAPSTFADGGKARLIRPLWNCRKRDIHAAARFFGFPQIRSCPYEDQLKDGDRHFLNNLLLELETRFPDLHSAMRHSMGDIRLAHLLDPRYRNIPDADSGKL